MLAYKYYRYQGMLWQVKFLLCLAQFPSPLPTVRKGSVDGVAYSKGSVVFSLSFMALLTATFRLLTKSN